MKDFIQGLCGALGAGEIPNPTVFWASAAREPESCDVDAQYRIGLSTGSVWRDDGPLR